ncbi:MAG TPA: hypothetical protein VMF67_17950 [Rhizomicrobium sp.]|nr:hypothetical protein [Rhizomicrobium sp.]
MFVDACAIVAMMAGEDTAPAYGAALSHAPSPRRWRHGKRSSFSPGPTSSIAAVPKPKRRSSNGSTWCQIEELPSNVLKA